MCVRERERDIERERERERAVTYLLLVHLLFNRGCHDQPVHHHVLLLPYTECAVHGLSIFGRVPGRVEDHDPVSPCTVQWQITGKGRLGREGGSEYKREGG